MTTTDTLSAWLTNWRYKKISARNNIANSILEIIISVMDGLSEDALERERENGRAFDRI